MTEIPRSQTTPVTAVAVEVRSQVRGNDMSDLDANVNRYWIAAKISWHRLGRTPVDAYSSLASSRWVGVKVGVKHAHTIAMGSCAVTEDLEEVLISSASRRQTKTPAAGAGVWG